MSAFWCLEISTSCSAIVEEVIYKCADLGGDGGPVHRGAFDWHVVAHARSFHQGSSKESMDTNCDLPDCMYGQDCVWVLLLVESGLVPGVDCC